MINWRRPSNRSRRLTLPLGPSNSYFFPTAIHGIRRRSAASASRERVKAFSFTRSCWRAASHFCGDTIGGVFMRRCPFPCSLSLSLLVAILFLLCFLRRAGSFFRVVFLARQFHGQYRQSSGGSCARRDQRHAC